LLWAERAKTERPPFRAGIFRATTGRREIDRALGRGRGRILSDSGIVTAHWTPLIKFPGKKLKRGSYVYAITCAPR
jgi:hypothetical protein